MSTTLLTKDEAAKILRLTPRQIGKLARRGELPSVKLPGDEVRFDPDDLRQWVESLKQPAMAERSRAQTIIQVKHFYGNLNVQISQAIGNGDVNIAMSEKGAVIQTTGAGNTAQAQNPKESPWGAIWGLIKSLCSWLVPKRR